MQIIFFYIFTINLIFSHSILIIISLAIKNRLFTADNLGKRGWAGNELCVLCGAHMESTDHLFLKCVYTRFVIGYGEGDLGFESTGWDIRDVWEKWKKEEGNEEQTRGRTALAANWWVI